MGEFFAGIGVFVLGVAFVLVVMTLATGFVPPRGTSPNSMTRRWLGCMR
jgi:hypothetical protein